MRLAAFGLRMALALGATSAESLMTEGFAYSRETVPGIPEGPGVSASSGRSLETAWFIYVVVRDASVPTEASVWLKGKHYSATLRKVASPVLVEHDPVVPTGKKDTLVPATSAPVYQVLPAEERSWSPANDAEKQLTQHNEVVVFLRAERASHRVPIKAVKPLRPAPGR